MPSVGMRRTTRVFGARVLRSGRRVWTGSGERKYTKTPNGEERIDLLESSGGGGGGGHHARDCKENGWQQNDVSANQEVLEMDIEEKEVESESKKLEHDGSVVDNSVGRVFTNVYTRKRKVGSNHFDAFVSGENTSTLKDKKCGKTYCRNSWSKKWSKKTRLCEMADACDPTVSSAMRKHLVKTLKIVVQSSCAMRYIVACLLNSVLRYMGKSRIRQDQLFAFFHSKSLSQVYSSCGIHFLQDSNFSLERGVCTIMGGNCSTPVFALNFSAVPFCFIHLHLSILLRGIRLSYILGQAVVLLILYLALGVVIYSFNRNHFKAKETHPVVDALYFCIVTMCTIGYGDITPASTSTKLFSIMFVLVGFGFIDILLSGMVSYVLDLQENYLLKTIKGGGTHDPGRLVFDVKKGRMRIRMKVALALGVVILCIGVGVAVMHYVERLGWLDSFYLSVMSVTTVGYGDRAFSSLSGRIFASIWLLVSTLAVARAFLYLAEARVDKRHRKMAKWVLGQHMTVAQFLAADIDNNGFVSKSEYVIYKLKEMQKVSDKDILQISRQFELLDKGNCGKITLADLMESNH